MRKTSVPNQFNHKPQAHARCVKKIKKKELELENKLIF